MRDVCLLRGHEKDICTLTWHPVHASLLSTGGQTGEIFHYLLDEPNPPNGGPVTSVTPYDSPDPSSAPAQVIQPAHQIHHAHDYNIWSLDWHPLGHILASGSNDRVTRFWARPRPGDSDYVNDRYHIGEEAAEAQGTWNRKRMEQQARDEEQEAQDEMDGLVDQKMPSKVSVVPGLPGLPGITAPVDDDGNSAGGGQSHFPGINGAAQPIFPASLFPNMPPPPGKSPGPDFSRLAQIFGGQLPPIPPPQISTSSGSGSFFPPPPPGFPQFQGAAPPPSLPAGFQPPPGFPMPPLLGRTGGLPGLPPVSTTDGSGAAGGVRRRGPLPSQQESLQAEMKTGKYHRAR